MNALLRPSLYVAGFLALVSFGNWLGVVLS